MQLKAQNSVRKPTECGSEGNSFTIQVSLNVYYPFCSTLKVMKSEGGTAVKESLANAGDARDEASVSGLGSFPGEGNGNPLHSDNSVFLPGRAYGQRRLAGYSPWGHRESDTTEHTCMPGL